ncbi:MAG: redoxin domain-containing protein [Planctomycetaceae bacterium]|nr:redoxin domain-containing protein [Planctomycetaceae bacterium]
MTRLARDFFPHLVRVAMTVGGIAILFVCATLTGCGGNTSDSGPGGAEVPQPGQSAIEEDLGPPPEGQSEPPVEDETLGLLETSADGQLAGAATDLSQQDRQDVSLKLTTWDEAEQLVASKTGRVVVLDFWSTSCVPCRREFPHFVGLHRDLSDQVACISYSVDYSGRASRPPESYREQVLEFLMEQGATFDNVLGTDDPDWLQERLDLIDYPTVYVYDRNGNLRKRFDNNERTNGEFTYEADVIPFVKSLLAEN